MDAILSLEQGSEAFSRRHSVYLYGQTTCRPVLPGRQYPQGLVAHLKEKVVPKVAGLARYVAKYVVSPLVQIPLFEMPNPFVYA